MKINILFTFLFYILQTRCVIPCVQSTNCIKQIYYWVDFNGKYPPESVIGGMTFVGKQTHIGSTYFPNYGVLPTILYNGDRHAYGTSNNTLLKSHLNTKVLCSTEPLTWRQVTVDSYFSEKCIFIEAGYENNCTLLIGRTRGVLGYQAITGKVKHPNCSKKLKLEIWDKDSESLFVSEDFELLGYCI